MTKKQPPIWLTWVLALIVGPGILVYAIIGLIDTGRHRSQQPASIEELVDKLQDQLPKVTRYNHFILTQTGLEIHGDTLLYSFQMEAPDTILALFRKPEFISMFREETLQGVIIDYKRSLLGEMACDARMVLSSRIYDKNGAPLYSIDYGPSDYLPLLNKE